MYRLGVRFRPLGRIFICLDYFLLISKHWFFKMYRSKQKNMLLGGTCTCIRRLHTSSFLLDFMTIFTSDALLGRRTQAVRQKLPVKVAGMGITGRLYRSRANFGLMSGTFLIFSLINDLFFGAPAVRGGHNSISKGESFPAYGGLSCKDCEKYACHRHFWL